MTTADDIALTALRKRRGMQAILASRLREAPRFKATSVLRHEVSERAVAARLPAFKTEEQREIEAKVAAALFGKAAHG